MCVKLISHIEAISKRFLKIFILVIYGTIVIGIIGCGENEDAAFIKASPPNNSTIAPEDTIIVTFDNTPVNLNVEFLNARSRLWELEGRTLTLFGKPKWTDGSDYVIIITWLTGRRNLYYTVRGHQSHPVVVIDQHYREGEKTLHADVDGVLLIVDGVEVYRQFQNTQTGDITLGEKDKIKVQVIFLNPHEEKLHLNEISGVEEVFGLRITDYDSAIIELHLSEKDFEVIGLKAGETTIKLQLVHGDHTDFRALPIPITVQ